MTALIRSDRLLADDAKLGGLIVAAAVDAMGAVMLPSANEAADPANG